MTEKIYALPDDEVEIFLVNYGLMEKIENEELRCFVCGNILTIETIGCIYPKDEEILLCCDNLLCMQKVIDITTPLRNTREDIYE